MYSKYLPILVSLYLFHVFVSGQTNFKEKENVWKEELFKSPQDADFEYDPKIQAPTIFIAIFVRNKEHSLPYFLNALYNQNYSKKRMALWIVTDHNTDKSAQLLETWVKHIRNEYHRVDYESVQSEWYYEGQKSNMDWPEERHVRLLQLRQQALVKARDQWADFILYVDADNILMNPYTIWHLMSADVTIVAPALNTLGSYSNFWCGQDERGYYKRTEDYFPIKNRRKLGTFQVPLVHSTFLIDLTHNDSLNLQFWPLRKDYNLDLDDIIIFSFNAKAAGIPVHVNNMHIYGYMPIPLKSDQTLVEEVETFTHLLMEVMTEPPVQIGIEITPSPILNTLPSSSKLGFDEIYMINLLRREDRYYRMKTVLDLQGISFKHFHAVDSKMMNTSYLKGLGIDMLPGFVDPYHGRTALTRGEIGCFLSHYYIWQEVVEKGYKQVIVLEDDVRFENAFSRKLGHVMNEIQELNLNWDLIYIGRKRMQTEVPEKWVPGSKVLVEADYSFWTLGYLLSLSGAKKLLAGNPLGKMVPVDEYLPIMFNKHPISQYMDAFPNRNVVALSVEPLIVYPTHYTGQENYFSDTETSSIWEEETKKDEL
ncbi:procollagen galactosyltransferase 1-like [Clavelina lepadiformis]|uniref:procollagen galactosyltransferase 1-like n=1 Tax=Clavelina lepadiformis TaxID=159417 RepID=UPI0040423AA1